MINPIEEHTFYEINNSFNAHYTRFQNDVEFYRKEKYWTNLALNVGESNPFLEYSFVPPQHNNTIYTPYINGVPFTCVEHVSICINGNAHHTLSKENGTTFETTLSFGDHTTENGTGYIPTLGWTRYFSDDYTTCCLIPKPTRNFNTRYRIDVVHLTNEYVLPNNYIFGHVAYGNIQHGNESFNQTETAYSLVQNTSLVPLTETIVILVKTFP